MNLLQSLDGIEHVEEIADLMPHMDDPTPVPPGSATTTARACTRVENPRPERSDRAQGARRPKPWPSTSMPRWNSEAGDED